MNKHQPTTTTANANSTKRENSVCIAVDDMNVIANIDYATAMMIVCDSYIEAYRFCVYVIDSFGPLLCVVSALICGTCALGTIYMTLGGMLLTDGGIV